MGRFFNVDNYAEAYLGYSPYQYAANNPIYYVDVNGDYIYVYDGGKNYKFDNGKLYGKDTDGNWMEHVPEKGSFLEQVYMSLKSIYEFSGSSNSSAGGGKSFGKSFLDYYNNDKINTIIFNAKTPPAAIRRYFKIEGSANFTDPAGINYTGIDLNPVTYFGSNFRTYNAMLSQIIMHELGHGILNINNVDNKADSWLLNTKSEVFATYIENRFLSERGLPLRSNYYSPNEGINFFKSSLLFRFNPINLSKESSIQNLQILNNFKKSLQSIPNTNFIFNN